MMDPKPHRATRGPRPLEVNGPLLTVLVLAITEWLSRSPYSLPDPAPLHLTAVVYSAFTGGTRHGLISTALVLLYTAYACSIPYVPRQLFHMTEENLRRALLMAFAAPAIAWMTGILKRRALGGEAEEKRSP